MTVVRVALGALFLGAGFAAQTAGAAEAEQAYGLATLPLGEPGEHVAMGDGGPVLFLLPCWNCRWKEFESFMERNTDKYRMHAFTFPGQGGTAIPELPLFSGETVWQDNVADSVMSVMDEEGVDDVVFVASSWGVKIAVEIAHRRPDRVAGIVNLDGQVVYSKSQMSFTGDAAEFDAGAIAVARRVRNEYLEETLRDDPDEWQRMNWVTLEDPVQRMLVHGWFMATPQDVMFNTWFENIVDIDNHNKRFSELRTRFLDVQALRARWDDDRRLQRRQAYVRLFEDERVRPPARFQTTWINGSEHLVPLSRPEVLDRIVDDFVSGREIPELYQ